MNVFHYPELDETVYRQTLECGLTLCVVPRKGFTRKLCYLVTDYGSVHDRFTLEGQEYTIPAGSYEGQTEDVQTLCVQSVLAVSTDLSEDLVYDLTKTLWENQTELSGMLSALSDLSVDNALEGITIDYHPGAVKYYKEIGMM